MNVGDELRTIRTVAAQIRDPRARSNFFNKLRMIEAGKPQRLEYQNDEFLKRHHESAAWAAFMLSRVGILKESASQVGHYELCDPALRIRILGETFEIEHAAA